MMASPSKTSLMTLGLLTRMGVSLSIGVYSPPGY
jgi:hypothetical protein